MKNALRIGLIAFCILFTFEGKAADSIFLTALEDVPLMAGLSEATEETMSFDTPAGRIVEAYALGNVTKESVLTYYKDSLPSLGWARNAHGRYVREGESLTVSVKMNGKTALVHFALSPQTK